MNRPVRRTVRLGLLLAVTVGIAYAQLPFSDAGRFAAKVLTQSGQVSILKDTQPWALSVGDTVQVRDIIISGIDGHALFQVSDGSTFEVFPNSRVVFRKNPPNWRDFLDLIVGKVRVHVEHMGTTPNPNRMMTPTAVISVRGTTFEVSVDDDDETTFIAVEEGQVEVEHALLPRSNTRVLNPGESMSVYRNEPIARNIDKGNIAQRVLRSLHDAAITMATRAPSGAGGLGGVTGGGGIGGVGTIGGVGDTGKVPAPPAPVPAPPPAPPAN